MITGDFRTAPSPTPTTTGGQNFTNPDHAPASMSQSNTYQPQHEVPAPTRTAEDSIDLRKEEINIAVAEAMGILAGLLRKVNASGV